LNLLVQILILLIVTFILILFIIIIKKTKTITQVLVTFSLQIIISQVSYEIFGLTQDQLTYHAKGLLLMNSLNSGEGYQNFGVGPGKQSFTYVLGTIYFWFGPHAIVGMYVNALILSSIPPILVMACNNLGLSKIAKLSSWLFVFMPSLFFWASGLRRESLAFVIIALSILSVSLAYKGRFAPASLLTLILIYAIQTTRPALLLVLLPGVFMGTLLSSKSQILKNLSEKRNRLTNLFITNFIIISHCIFAYVLISPRLQKYGGYFEEISNPNFSTSILNSSPEVNFSPVGFAYNIYRAFFGPPLWEWNSASMLIFGLEGIIYLLIFIAIIWSFIKSKNYTKQIIILLSCSVPLLLLSSLFLANYGINSRVRAHYLIPLLPIVALFLQDVINFMARKRNPRILKTTPGE
jgi:hypothetical protein